MHKTQAKHLNRSNSGGYTAVELHGVHHFCSFFTVLWWVELFIVSSRHKADSNLYTICHSVIYFKRTFSIYLKQKAKNKKDARSKWIFERK